MIYQYRWKPHDLTQDRLQENRLLYYVQHIVELIQECKLLASSEKTNYIPYTHEVCIINLHHIQYLPANFKIANFTYFLYFVILERQPQKQK